MGLSLTLVATLVPFVIFGVALLLRIAAASRPESVSFAGYRHALLVACYTCVATGFVSLIVGIIYTEAVGVIQLILFFLGFSQLVDVEAIVFGQRRRTQQAELLWMLASTVRNEGNLPDELEFYAMGRTGKDRRKLFELADRLRDGTPLSEIAVPQGLLPPSVTVEIQAGLQAGRLHEVLRDVAIRQTKSLVEGSGMGQLQMALMLPAAVITVAFVIVAFLTYYIIPKFKAIFDDFGVELPHITRLMISISDSWFALIMILQPFLYLPIIATIMLAIAELKGWTSVSRWLLGAWTIRPYSAELLRSLSQSVSGGIPLSKALQHLSFSSGSSLVHKRLSNVRGTLDDGGPCWPALLRQRFISNRECELLGVAETAGNLPWTLNAIASAIERTWLFRVQVVLKIFGPAVLLALSVIVAFLAVGFFMPLVKLLNDLS